NGGLYCTGSNSTGQLGLGTNLTELYTPKLLPRGALRSEKISRVSCGESHTAVVTESGKLYTCGDGRHGKLGLEENENNVHELTFVQRYKELFVSNVITFTPVVIIGVITLYKLRIILFFNFPKVACGGCHTILVGQRRETNNRSQREDNSQVEHIQKRNPLPPLKLNRRQSETLDEHVGETTKRKNSTESVTNGTVEASLEKIEETDKGNVGSDVTDPTNDVEKSDSPEKRTSEQPEEKSSNEEENAGTTLANTRESEESERQDENSELRTEEEAPPTKTDAENNVQEEEKSESMNDEKDNKENESNETSVKARENSAENNEEMNKDNDDSLENKDETDSNKDAKESMQESDNGDDAKRETSPKEETSPSDSTPPPKPPRLKSGSGNSSAERASSMEKEDDEEGNENEGKTEDIPVKKSDATEEDELSGGKEESGSTKPATRSGSTKSARSAVAAEETIEIDNQNDKDRVVEEEKVNSDNAQDDADVVQSPPPKT
ncbi:unnamed protein product, partial [Heterotrigona itama]